MNATSYAPGTTGGNKEWLGNELTILEPEETPFTSMLDKATDATSTFHEVLADRLRAPRMTGTREGDSGPKGGNKSQKRQRFGSYLHRWHDTYSVTDVQQAISRAGGNAVVDNEYGAAKAKCLREMKRDIEATLLGAQDTQGGGDDEMKTRGAFKWLATDSSPVVPVDFQPPAAQRVTGQADLEESDVNGVLKSLKSQAGGSKEYVLIAGNDYIEDIDLYAVQDSAGGAASRYAYPVKVSGGETKTISMMVKIFQTSFGRVVVHGSDFINLSSTTGLANATAALILRREHWKLHFLEDLHAVDDWDDAAGMGGFAKAIGGLFCKMPRGSAYICNSLNS